MSTIQDRGKPSGGGLGQTYDGVGSYILGEIEIDIPVSGLWGGAGGGVPEGKTSYPSQMGEVTPVLGIPVYRGGVRDIISVDSRDRCVPGRGIKVGGIQLGPISGYTLCTATCGIKYLS